MWRKSPPPPSVPTEQRPSLLQQFDAGLPPAWLRRTRKVAVGSAVTMFAAMVAARAGWLPDGWRAVLIAALGGSLAITLGIDQWHHAKENARTGSLRWTGFALAASATAAVAVGGLKRHLPSTVLFGAFIPLIAIGLIADAWQGVRSGRLSPFGAAGAAGGGFGIAVVCALVVVGNDLPSAEWYRVFWPAVALLAFGGLAYFRERGRIRDGTVWVRPPKVSR